MGVNVNPYLNFRGQAREAMEFYHSVFGGEVSRMTFAEGGMPVGDDEQDHVMHSQLAIESRLILMAADLPSSVSADIGNGTVSLSGDDDATLHGWWDGLSEGATIGVPLAKAPWGDTFGMLTDRYGVNWLVDIAGQAT